MIILPAHMVLPLSLKTGAGFPSFMELVDLNGCPFSVGEEIRMYKKRRTFC
jgi:hypothetical protein